MGINNILKALEMKPTSERDIFKLADLRVKIYYDYENKRISIVPYRCLDEYIIRFDCIRYIIIERLAELREIFEKSIRRLKPELALLTSVPFLQEDLLLGEYYNKLKISYFGKYIFSMYIRDDSVLRTNKLGRLIADIFTPDIIGDLDLPIELYYEIHDIRLNELEKLSEITKRTKKLIRGFVTEEDLLIHFEPS